MGGVGRHASAHPAHRRRASGGLGAPYAHGYRRGRPGLGTGQPLRAEPGALRSGTAPEAVSPALH
ncbi:MAG: hypothetical protein C0522_02595, partial [Rhodocyclaceae bacterium]|nr:hypothetical protein [Rhodocyclaceae bacterium]